MLCSWLLKLVYIHIYPIFFFYFSARRCQGDRSKKKTGKASTQSLSFFFFTMEKNFFRRRLWSNYTQRWHTPRGLPSMWCIAASFLLCQCEKNDKTSIRDRESNTQILASFSFYSFRNIVVISKPAAKKLQKKKKGNSFCFERERHFLPPKKNKKTKRDGWLDGYVRVFL